ncbi:MAG: PulJ/GspJ family protein, partial [Akkermansiaceae bacterium]
MKVEFRQLSARSAKGFSLFELVIAIAIAGFVLTSIFKIADGSVRANSKMVDIQ